MKLFLKRLFKRNTHNLLFKALAGFGRSMNRFYENRNHDIYSNGESFVLKQLAKLNPSIIFDVGANTGDWMVMASSHCKTASLYCFEPVLETYQKLQRAIQVNSLNRIHPVNSGLYKEQTKALINTYVSDEHTSDEHSSLYDAKGPATSVEKVEIDLITGDGFIGSNKLDTIDFIKLDVEGAEMDALLGLEKIISENKVRMIQFEYGYINLVTKMLLVDFYKFFRKHGYIVGKLYPKKVEFREYEWKHEDFIGPNFIAVRKSDQELISLLN